jgi:RimJ/RimL family protein N-acetyltransferase
MVVLEGTNCCIHSYNQKESKKDILYDLWKIMELDGDTDKALWTFEHKDLAQFIQYITDPHIVLFIVYTKDYSEYVGFTWFSDIVPNFKAHSAIYICKKYRKILTDEVSKLSIDFIFSYFNLKELWQHTPWENAHKLSLRLGSTEIAILPNYILINGEPHNYYISRLKRS